MNKREASYRCRIYYDDTDAGGVVYYANYLKFCERAKQEFFLARGCDLFKLHKQGLYLVVRSVKANYKRAVSLGESVEVYVSIRRSTRTSVTLFFEIFASGELCADVEILSVAVDSSFKIVRLPECVVEAIKG